MSCCAVGDSAQILALRPPSCQALFLRTVIGDERGLCDADGGLLREHAALFAPKVSRLGHELVRSRPRAVLIRRCAERFFPDRRRDAIVWDTRCYHGCFERSVTARERPYAA